MIKRNRSDCNGHYRNKFPKYYEDIVIMESVCEK
jgi:hypothetical protein